MISLVERIILKNLFFFIKLAISLKINCDLIILKVYIFQNLLKRKT
jgi:hypothetical protein